MPATTTTGTHAPDGIFIAYGPSIEEGKELMGAQLRDVSPTALYAMNVPLTMDMDGQPLLDIFVPERVPSHPVLHIGTSYKDGLTGDAQGQFSSSPDVFTDEEANDLEERLRALGYLG